MNEQHLIVVMVGCGGFLRNYLPVYGHIPNLRVVACVDADIGAAQVMAQSLGAGGTAADLEVAARAAAD